MAIDMAKMFEVLLDKMREITEKIEKKCISQKNYNN